MFRKCQKISKFYLKKIDKKYKDAETVKILGEIHNKKRKSHENVLSKILSKTNCQKVVAMEM